VAGLGIWNLRSLGLESKTPASKTVSLCSTKETIYSEETTSKLVENICELRLMRGLISRIYKELSWLPWLMPIILATQEAEIRRDQRSAEIRDQPRQNSS
jgi:hypothetical protein